MASKSWQMVYYDTFFRGGRCFCLWESGSNEVAGSCFVLGIADSWFGDVIVLWINGVLEGSCLYECGVPDDERWWRSIGVGRLIQ